LSLRPHSIAAALHLHCFSPSPFSVFLLFLFSDVQVNPFSPYVIAGAYENGMIQIWDLRKTHQAFHSIHAHQGLILTLDWHPEDKSDTHKHTHTHTHTSIHLKCNTLVGGRERIRT
jgi:WD40 repeat protein